MTRAIHQTATLKASPDELFDAFLDPKRHAAITGAPARVCVTQTQCFFHRMPLLRLTRRTSKCPGYSRGSSVRGNVRGDRW
jgi:hypothetical protein